MSLQETIKKIKVSSISIIAEVTSAFPISRGLKQLLADELEKDKQAEGKWISSPCYLNCGGFCVNYAYVVNGTVLRQKTDDLHSDSFDNPQQRGCARGRSTRKTLMGVDRLKYPMKRKHWEIGGGDKSLRGKDEWVRISWDEALDIAASEYKRIKETYGNQAIMNCTLGYTVSRFVGAYGGALQTWGTYSTGGWSPTVLHMFGLSPSGIYPVGYDNTVNDRMEMRKSKLIVLWGNNPAWTSHGMSSYALLAAKKAGAKIIVVDPMYNATAIAFADQWIPVRPSTDAALLLGIAHYMITNNLHDQDFLDRYTVGFDAEHMPEGFESEENFKDYVLGVYDGQPKTPEWAESICGTDADLIKSFAREIAVTKPMSFMSGFAPARTYNGEQFCQAFLTVGWMTGNVGKSGACVGVSSAYGSFDFGPRLVNYGMDGLPAIKNPLFPYPSHWSIDPKKNDWYGPNGDEAWEAVLTGGYQAGVRGRIPADIRMIDHTGYGNALNQAPNLLRGIEAHRKVEFVLAVDLVPSPSVQYADVVLPVTHTWERYGHTGLATRSRAILIWGSQVVKPMFEAKDNDWISRELAKRVGIDPDLVVPIDLKQQIFNKIAGATVLNEDGKTYEPLVTITEKDLVEYGVVGKIQQGRIPIKELQEKGYYLPSRHEDDNYGFIAFKEFVEDPIHNPLKTTSGKLEICCPALAQYVKDHGFTTISAIPKYQPPKYGYEETKNGKYPLQIVTPHYMRGSHSSLDNNPWLREAFPLELFINPVDAEKRGLKEGDTVRVYNKFGSLLRYIKVTERIMPGTISLGEGGWLDYDEKNGIDRGGAANILQGSVPNGVGNQPWNTNIVEVEKFNMPIPPDYKRAPKVLL